MLTTANELSYSEIESLRMGMNSNRDPYVSFWRSSAKFVSPNRFIGTEPNERNKGQQKTRDILRNEASRSLRIFVAGMNNGATPRSRPWWNLQVVNTAKKNAKTDRYFSNVVKAINEHFQISNLYGVLPVSYKDIGIFSNSAYAMLPHPRYGFFFKPITVGTYSIGTDSEGTVNQFNRDFTLTVRQIVEQYGKLKPNGHIDWSNFNPWIQRAYERSDYQMVVYLSSMTLPNHNPIPDSILPHQFAKYQEYVWTRGIASPNTNLYGTGMRYTGQQSIIDPERSQFCSIRGWDYFPYIVNRWEMAPESDWGVDGPTELALDDIKTLQETERYRLEGAAKLVKPPMVGPASLRRHQSTILAGGITYVDEASEGTKFRAAFEVDPKLGELINSQNDYIRSIRSSYFEDVFMMMAGDQKISHVTAREIEERAGEKLTALSPVLGQLDKDQGSRLIQNAFYLLSKMRNRLPEMPPELAGEEVRPDYISVLHQAAKASLIGSTDKLVGFVGALAQTTGDQSITKILKNDVIVRQYADYTGVSPEFLRDDAEYSEVQAEMARQQQAQAELEKSKVLASNVKDLASSEVSDNNMLGYYAQAQGRF